MQLAIEQRYGQERQKDYIRLVHVRLGEFRLYYHSSRGAFAKLLRARYRRRKGRPNRKHNGQCHCFVGRDGKRRRVLCISVRPRIRRDIGLFVREEKVPDILRIHR